MLLKSHLDGLNHHENHHENPMKIQVHQVEPTQGRVTFDIDPAATGLVLREATRGWCCKVGGTPTLEDDNYYGF